MKILDLKEESPQNWSAIIETTDTILDESKNYSSKWSLKIKVCGNLVCKFGRKKYQEPKETPSKN